MDLVPVLKKGVQNPTGTASTQSQPEANEFSVPVERQQQIGVTYAIVETRILNRTIRAVGFIVPDQKRNWSFVSRVEGYVQELFVTSPGELVAKDAPLLSMYSPDLLTAERELVILLASRHEEKTNETAGRLIEAAKLRLRQWNVTENQIADLEKSGKPSEILTLRSPFHGIVAKVAASQGSSVKVGDALVDVADLSKVWVWVDFYETEIGLLRQGQKVVVASVSYPGHHFDGTVALVDPFVDPIKRTARVRIDIENPEFLLRPGMYVNAELQLEPVTALAVPVDAIMPTGLRNLVFLDKGGGRLEPRFVSLGEKFGDFYAVQKGLTEGERVVSSANFLIDAESKVQGALKDFDDNDAKQPPADGSPENASPVVDSSYQGFIKTYLALHDLLAADRFDGVSKLGDELCQESVGIAGGDKVQVLQQAVNTFKPADLHEARVGFGRISAALLDVLKEIPAPRILYVMRCPMWNSSPSEWVQVSKEIQNPFMGQAMATCGETVRTLGQ
jgi:Cu(I)/Ag(I) efflux system membrane fusion protein